MTMNKTSFVLYLEYYDKFAAIPREERGDLIMAIFEYQIEGAAKTQLSPISEMAFLFIKSQLDRDNRKYQNICARNQANGEKGGRPKKQQKTNEKTLSKKSTLKKPKNPKNPLGYLPESVEHIRDFSVCTQANEKTQKPKKPDNDNDDDNDNDNDDDTVTDINKTTTTTITPPTPSSEGKEGKRKIKVSEIDSAEKEFDLDTYLGSDEHDLFVAVCDRMRDQCVKETSVMNEATDFIAYNEARDWKGLGGEDVIANLTKYVTRWVREKARKDTDFKRP